MKTMQGMIDELVHKATYGPEGCYTLWEKRLQLWIRPKPLWCPDRLWAKLLSIVLYQVEVK